MKFFEILLHVSFLIIDGGSLSAVFEELRLVYKVIVESRSFLG